MSPLSLARAMGALTSGDDRAVLDLVGIEFKDLEKAVTTLALLPNGWIRKAFLDKSVRCMGEAGLSRTEALGLLQDIICSVDENLK